MGLSPMVGLGFIKNKYLKKIKSSKIKRKKKKRKSSNLATAREVIQKSRDQGTALGLAGAQSKAESDPHGLLEPHTVCSPSEPLSAREMGQRPGPSRVRGGTARLQLAARPDVTTGLSEKPWARSQGAERPEMAPAEQRGLSDSLPQTFHLGLCFCKDVGSIRNSHLCCRSLTSISLSYVL